MRILVRAAAIVMAATTAGLAIIAGVVTSAPGPTHPAAFRICVILAFILATAAVVATPPPAHAPEFAGHARSSDAGGTPG